MGEEAKRLYIGNLPSDITDTDLRNKFSKFGSVEAVEIKLKKDNEGNTINTFAFLNLSTSQGNIAKCISTFSNTTWKGHPMKIQMAQESFMSRLQKERQENQMKNRRDIDPDDTKNEHKDSESASLGNFYTDKFSHRDKLEKFGQDNKYHQKTNEGLVSKKFQNNWGLGDKNSKDIKASVRNYNPMEIFLNSKSNQKDKNSHENETVGQGKLQTNWKLKESSRNFTIKNSDYNPFQMFLNSSNIQKKEASQSENSVMKIKHQIGTSSENTKGKLEHLFLSDQETQHSSGIKNKKAKGTNAQKEHNYSDFDSDNSDEEIPVSAKHISMFQGTQSILVSESKKKLMQHSPAGSMNNDASSEEKNEAQRENAGSRSSSLGLKLEEEMMKRFEAFSNSWKDSGTIGEAIGEKANKFYVTPSDTEKINETSVVQKQGGKKSKSIKNKQSEKPRVKMERHALSNQRRIKSLQEKDQVMKGQKRIIKEALLAIDSGCSGNKKIVFESEDKETPADHAPYDHVQTNSDDDHSSQQAAVKRKQHILFTDDAEDEASNERFRVQQQFEGVKGEKLMQLQNSVTSDDRFHLDERFYESDEVTMEDPSSKTSLHMKKKIFRDTSQLRFDPTKEDHEKFILKCDKEESNEGKRKKKDKNMKKEEEPQPEVSRERYFEVSHNFNSLFKKDVADKSQGADFSLLKLMGRLDKTEAEKEPEDLYKVASLTPQKQPWTTENPFHYDSGESEQELEAKTTEQEKKDVLPTLEYFFFQTDDERLKEGTAFFSQQAKHMDFDAVGCMKQEKQQLLLMKKKIKHMAKKQKSKKKPGRGMRKHFRTRKPVK